jgi:hypothetical protein
MKAKHGANLLPVLSSVSKLRFKVSSNSALIISYFIDFAKLGNVWAITSLSLFARSSLLSIKTKMISLNLCNKMCSFAVLKAIIGDPSSPLEYMPGPAKPSMYTILPEALDKIGNHAAK